MRLGNPDERRAQADQLCELVKWIDLAERTRFVAEIGDALEVALPAQAPEDRRAMGWDDILALEARGVEFGPHSRHHCILSRVDEATARDEIFGSWETMRSKCARAVPIFCYPNGTPESYTMRDERLVREAGLVGAVAYHRERIRPSSFPLSSRFRLPRVEWTNDPLRAAFTASGLFGLG